MNSSRTAIEPSALVQFVAFLIKTAVSVLSSVFPHSFVVFGFIIVINSETFFFADMVVALVFLSGFPDELASAVHVTFFPMSAEVRSVSECHFSDSFNNILVVSFGDISGIHGSVFEDDC